MPPNLLLILLDDLGARDLACYGSAFYETPTLDRLAAQGLLCTNAYAACPVCSPTRASILTGKYPARLGLTQYIGGASQGQLLDVPYLHYLPLEEVSLARALHEGGYQTWHVGKWHLGDEPFYPTHHGFEVNIAGAHHGHPPGPNHYWSPYNIETLTPGPPGEYLTDRLTHEAINLIQARDPARPFFLNLWHYTVHTPCQAPEPLIEKYRHKAARLGLDKIPALVEGEYFPVQHKAHLRVQRRIFQSDPTYAAMIENLDTNIARLLSTLDDQGLTDNTLVVFTSDNGGLATSEGSPTCNAPLAEGKGWNLEGGTRVCQIFRWPAVIAPGRISHQPTISTDYYPTFLEAAGLPLRPQQHCDGLSLLPLLQADPAHEPPLPRDALYWHYPHYSNQGNTPAAAILRGRWKLIQYFEDRPPDLFDLETDLSETRNLAPAHPEITRDLLARLTAWHKEVRAQIPPPNPDWESWRQAHPVPATPNNAHE